MLWQKLDYMVHLGLRPWWTSRCDLDAPLCGMPRLDARPLTGCHKCTLINDTAPVTLEAWLRDDSTASGGAGDAEAHAAPWPRIDAGTADDDRSRQGQPCPTGANHGCCMLPTDCASGQVRPVVPFLEAYPKSLTCTRIFPGPCLDKTLCRHPDKGW